ncbi:MAG TPA: glycoside hydrolase family 18 protein [Planctomycetota bacterium]|nr:glycoside hydrolase family 18 protein [Planctomycetota bacterium]
MKLWARIAKPPWRTFVLGGFFLVIVFGAYALWSPGEDVTDGRHDLGQNGIYLQHGWLGDDTWFEAHGRTDRMADFRKVESIRELASLLRRHHITDVYPHVCPTERSGKLPEMDSAQVRRFLDEFREFRVMPWVGGVRGVQALPHDSTWRSRFAEAIRALLEAHPRFAGIHVNIEPCPSGTPDFLQTLEAVREAIPRDKVLSVAAYPPPTFWQRTSDVHWDEAYFREVARRVDQIVVMMYDTSLEKEKLYRNLMVSWTREVLDWSNGTKVLLGLPAYDDQGVRYHNPQVENLSNGLLGIHGGLLGCRPLPTNYQGVAIYSEWEMDPQEWRHLRKHFLKSESN